MFRFFIIKHAREVCKLTTRSKKHLSTPINVSVNPTSLPPAVKIDSATIEHLERLSLVDFGDERGIKIVEDAIRFADRICEVDTRNVEPMVTVLENQSLFLREDVSLKETSRADILSHAAKTEEEYYIAPAGNIELKPVERSTLVEETVHKARS